MNATFPWIDLRTYTITPRLMPEYLELFERMGLPVLTETLGNPLGFYTSVTGQLNQFVHLWGYESLAEYERRGGTAGRASDVQGVPGGVQAPDRGAGEPADPGGQDGVVQAVLIGGTIWWWSWRGVRTGWTRFYPPIPGSGRALRITSAFPIIWARLRGSGYAGAELMAIAAMMLKGCRFDAAARGQGPISVERW